MVREEETITARQLRVCIEYIEFLSRVMDGDRERAAHPPANLGEYIVEPRVVALLWVPRFEQRDQLWHAYRKLFEHAKLDALVRRILIHDDTQLSLRGIIEELFMMPGFLAHERGGMSEGLKSFLLAVASREYGVHNLKAPTSIRPAPR